MQELILKFIAAKEKEEAATQERRALADEIVEALNKKEEGQETTQIGDYKVTTKRTINRRVDWKAFDEVSAQYADLVAPVKMKPELDKKGLDYYKTNAPAYYQNLMREAITETPGANSVSVTVSEVEK